MEFHTFFFRVRPSLRITGKIDINAKDNHGMTAIMEAIKNRRIPILKKLLWYKDQIDWNIQNNNGDTALHILLKSLNHTYFISFGKFLFTKMAHIDDLNWNVQNTDGNTAAILAIKGLSRIFTRFYYKAVVEKMIKDRRVNWNIKNKFNSSPISIALSLEEPRNPFIRRSIQEILNNDNIALDFENNELYDAKWKMKKLVEEILYYVKHNCINKENKGSQNEKCLIIYALKHHIKFAKILRFSPFAVKTCREYVREIMLNDDKISGENNITEFIYVLQKNMDNFAEVLLSALQTEDILCLIFYKCA